MNIISLLLVLAIHSQAAPSHPIPMSHNRPIPMLYNRPIPMPDNGFWVVITSADAPRLTTVEFYSLDNQLMYKEQLKNIHLDVNKRKIRKLLNHSLQTVLSAWERNRQPLKEQDIVASCVHR